MYFFFFFFQAEDGIRDVAVTGVQTCALPILFCCLAPCGAIAPSTGSFQVSALYPRNELDRSAGAYWPKDGQRKGDSQPSSANSGDDLVAAERPRGFLAIGGHRRDSLLFLQWRTLQDLRDL